MLYFIVTTSIFNKCLIRKEQYINGINKLKKTIHELNILNYKIIIVENNGKRCTFLDMLDCEVYYTENNFLQTGNKGIKELRDILDCINKYNIKGLNNYNDLYLDNVLTVNAWNEWNEQAILEPNNVSGYENIETVYNFFTSTTS